MSIAGLTGRSYAPVGFGSPDGDPPAPRAVRFALCLATVGSGALLVASLLASTIAVCTDECNLEAHRNEDVLLRCVDHCVVQGTKSTGDNGKSTGCENLCAKNEGFTRRQVEKRRETCEDACKGRPHELYFASLLGVLGLVPVVPLLGSYKNSCRCECCAGEGCNQRLAFNTVSWVTFTISCLWVLPTVVEDADEVGGKILFGLSQGIAAITMWASRAAAERLLARQSAISASSGRLDRCSELRVIGAPVVVGNDEPTIGDLHREIRELKQQVSELVKMQASAVQTAATRPAEDFLGGSS